MARLPILLDVDALRELVAAMLQRLDTARDDAPTERIYQAVVDAVNTGPPPTVDLLEAGDTSTVIPNVAHLDSYSPTPGDTVWLIRRDEDRIVLGKLAE